MYTTRKVNGVPAIHRDGQLVLGVCDRDWEFANWLCALLNELGRNSEFLLNEQGCEWFDANDRPLGKVVHHA